MNRTPILILLLFCNLSFSQTNSTDEKVMKMMEVLGSTERMKVVVYNMIKSQENENLELIDSEYWQTFKKEQIDYNELLQMLIPIYKKHFTVEEIEIITEFYSSPIGQSMVKKFPLISAESIQAGTVWGQKMFEKIQQNFNQPLANKFYIPTNDCSELKNGKFRYFDLKNNEVVVNRQNDIQEERVNGSLYKLKVEWINDCQYKVWNYQEDGNYKDMIPFIVTIYEYTDSAYKFVYKQKDGNEYFEGEMEISK